MGTDFCFHLSLVLLSVLVPMGFVSEDHYVLETGRADLILVIEKNLFIRTSTLVLAPFSVSFVFF